MVSGLAAKLLGGQAGEGADLLSTFSKLGFKPEQIEAFLPKALELIKTYLSPELLQKIIAALPAITKYLRLRPNMGRDGHGMPLVPSGLTATGMND